MQIGLLALQGAFADHQHLLQALGASVVEVRRASDLNRIERLILPGGESTVMSKYIEMFGLAAPLQVLISQGLPVWGICAGCILLANRVDQTPGRLSALNIAVTRNAYGRQAQSAVHKINIPRLYRSAFPAAFIRAPKITRVHDGVVIHAVHAGDPLFVQQDNVMATTFHPELTEDPVVHDYFLRI